MKLFRDVFSAIMVGIMGGLLVTTISYYNHHKEDGVMHTMLAVLNSFDEVTKAYEAENADLYDVGGYKVEEDVLEAFLQTANDGSEGDILAMEGDDGNIEEGAPYSGILRFHVRANSDSQEDQELKMAVKEDVVAMLKPMLRNCDSVKQSKDVIVSNMQNIYTTAVNTIVEQGYDYDVKVYVTKEDFPVKTYGDLTFPAGEYQALRIDIGKAQGQNWWCVMYPPLCFIDESTAVVSEDGKELLKKNLTDEEYRQLFTNPDVEVKTSFKLYDWLMGK
ncbi:MAG: stage II sporulation protein R [Lachnospiraceae bacterium]